MAAAGATPAEERATILWKGETHPIGMLGGREFVVSDAARALGLTVASDASTGVLTITGGGHQILLGPGTAQVPVDRRIVPISGPARLVAGALYAPLDFFEKVLFPLGGAAGTWDAAKKTWTLVPAGPPPLSIEIAVVHVAPTTQVVFRLSAAAKTATATSERSFQVRFADTKIDPPFPEKKYDDPLVASVRFAGEIATIDFREPGLAARAYPLTSPDRLVVEIGRRAALPAAPAAPAGPSTAAPAAPADAESLAPVTGAPPLTIVVDPGHGGGETGAIGPGGLQEKEATLEIAKRIAATLPRVLACRAVLTRDSDIQLPLDDRTSIANHEKADLFLSIHANSSRNRKAAGVETYILNFASNADAAAVAARENAAAVGSMRNLPDMVRAITQGNKRDESRELASAVQESMVTRLRPHNPPLRDLGVKQAPFVVLIGAGMPSVLAEIAFISHDGEGGLLRTEKYRQRIAEALAAAVIRYTRTLKPVGTVAAQK